MERRKFLKKSALASSFVFIPESMSSMWAKPIKSIGVQLFSLPKLLEKDFKIGIELLSGMGYKEIQMYGPFPFSVNSVKESWKAITPMLGFEGSGYFGHSAKEVRTILDDAGMKATATHLDLETLQTRMNQVGEAANILGFEYVGIAAIPEDKRKNLDDYKKMAETFNRIGAEAKKAGLKFAYHNHGYGLQEMDGKIPIQVLIEETDPDLVYLEMDIFWTTAGGANPVDYLKAYPKRYRLMHLKDMKEIRHFSGDGGSPQEWMELFPYMTTLGSGAMDIETIVKTARKSGVKHFFVEQDMVANPEIALKKSLNYLKSL